MSKKEPKKTVWAYGVTTIPERIDSHLPQTLKSLVAAGFPSPRLFIDDCKDPSNYDCFGLEYTNRWPRIRIAGNWVLSLYELYIRNASADFFAIFQDDFVTYPNLREYLEWCKYPNKGYWNLYTFPVNIKHMRKRLNLPPDQIGWFQANQMGKGAVALVLSNAAVVTLLGYPYLLKRFPNVRRGHRAIDGGIVDAFKPQGWKEYCHNPSLVQHTGDISSHGNHNQQRADCFCGESFECMALTVTSVSGPK